MTDPRITRLIELKDEILTRMYGFEEETCSSRASHAEEEQLQAEFEAGIEALKGLVKAEPFDPKLEIASMTADLNHPKK
jgi:hypothetical protein